MVAGVVSNLVKCSFALLVPLYAALACSSDSESPGGSGDGTQRPCEGAECGKCAEACPTGARKFGNVADPKSDISQIIKNKRVFVLKEELNTVPTLYYYFD